MPDETTDDAIAELLQRGYARPIPAGFADALLRRLQDRLPTPRPALKARWVPALAAMLLIAAGIAWWTHRPSDLPAPAPAPRGENNALVVAPGTWWPSDDLTANARSEFIPPATLKDLLAAKCIAVGRFIAKDGKPQFAPERTLRWDATPQLPMPAVKLSPDGKLLLDARARGEDDLFLGHRSVDPARRALWFFGVAHGPNSFVCQPVELADGFAALLANKPPELLFGLLQRLESERRWTALEELFANKPAPVITRLHEIALQPDSDAAYDATTALMQTRLLEPDRFWGKWYALPAANPLRDILLRHNRPRVLSELRAALADQKDEPKLMSLLHLVPYEAPEKADLALRYLDNPSPGVRQWALGRIWDRAWELNDRAARSPQAKTDLQTLGKQVVPLLEARSKTEKDPSCRSTLTRMLALKDGVPWLLRIPPEEIHEPIPPYSETAELKQLLSTLTSSGSWRPHDARMAAAGKEVAQHFFDDGLAALKAAALATTTYNTQNVYDGMGYVRDPRMFDHLADLARSHGVGASGYSSLVRAIGTQNDKRSLAVLQELVKDKATDQYAMETFGVGLVDGLGEMTDPKTLDFLKSLQPRINYHAKVPYVLARARHGDTWAVNELIGALEQPPRADFLGKDIWNTQDVAAALCVIDTPQTTAALKKYLGGPWLVPSDPLSELARRDPAWVADRALAQMSSSSWAERNFAGNLFAQLTARRGQFTADLFASERPAAIKPLADWFAAHKYEPRSQWLITYFRDKGFKLDRLDKSALPTLIQALDADYPTFRLAMEQIETITGKSFGNWQQPTYQGQPRMKTRVLGWLQSRHLLDPR